MFGTVVSVRTINAIVTDIGNFSHIALPVQVIVGGTRNLYLLTCVRLNLQPGGRNHTTNIRRFRIAASIVKKLSKTTRIIARLPPVLLEKSVIRLTVNITPCTPVQMMKLKFNRVGRVAIDWIFNTFSESISVAGELLLSISSQCYSRLTARPRDFAHRLEVGTDGQARQEVAFKYHIKVP